LWYHYKLKKRATGAKSRAHRAGAEEVSADVASDGPSPSELADGPADEHEAVESDTDPDDVIIMFAEVPVVEAGVDWLWLGLEPVELTPVVDEAGEEVEVEVEPQVTRFGHRLASATLMTSSCPRM